MLTISRPLSAGQAHRYHAEEFQNARDNYYTVGDQVPQEDHRHPPATYAASALPAPGRSTATPPRNCTPTSCFSSRPTPRTAKFGLFNRGSPTSRSITMGDRTFGEIKAEFEQRVDTGEFIGTDQRPGAPG